MLPNSSENAWIRRTRWLTQALIISGTLNIGLIATFAYFALKDKQKILAIAPLRSAKEALSTNFQLVHSYAMLPFQELLLRLENRDLSEEGLRKRDLALACLVAFHYFNLDKALGQLPLQKRGISLASAEGQDPQELVVFPGLTEAQFQAILHFAKTEKWPFTSQGLFEELKRSTLMRDPSLLEAFYLSSEFHTAYTLLTKTGVTLSREQIVDLLCEGDWKTLAELTQKSLMEISLDRKRTFLTTYFQQHHSKLAAKALLETERDFVLKRFDDAQILTLLDLYPEKSTLLETFAKELLSSPRTDEVCQRAAQLLYAFAGELFPESYDHKAALQHFFPPVIPKQEVSLPTSNKVPISKSKKRIHVVEAGETLWKIARKYQVSVDEIMRVNHMETEKLRTGKKLEIPEKSKN